MFAAFHERDYVLFYCGAMSSNIGMWMRAVAQGWLVVTLTNSELYLGLVSFCAMIPSLLFSPLGGVLSDRYDNRKILMVSQALSALFVGLLGTLVVMDIVQIWEIMLIAFLNGTFAALSSPAFQVIVPELVGRKNLMNAIALNSARFNLTRAIGPTIGGFLIKFIQIGGAYYCNAATYLVFLVTMLFVHPKHKGEQIRVKQPGVLSSLSTALVYVWGHNAIRPVMLIAGIQTLLIAPYTTLLPAYAKNILHIGSGGYGLLLAAVGLGAFASAMILAYLGEIRYRGRLMVIAQVVFAVGVAVFSQSRWLAPSVVALIFVGWALVAFLTTGNTMLQTIVPNEVRGRVMAFWMMVIMGLLPIGSLVAGSVAAQIGSTWTLTGGAVLTLLISGAVVLMDRDFLDPEVTKSIEGA